MSKQNIYLGIDIGATKTLFLAVRFSGKSFKILESARCETPHGEKQILGMVEASYKRFAEKYKIAGIGIGFAGPVDYKKGAALFGPNLKTKKIEFKKKLEKALKIPVKADNDVKCFLLAESAFGAAKGFKNAVGITIGTGVGGAIMIDGKLYRGANNLAGEVGHTEIGLSIEMEVTASGSGLSKVYRELTGKKISSFEIIELAKKKNPAALEAIDKVSQILGLGLASLIEIFDPEILVIGGGMSKVGMIVNKAKQFARKKIFAPQIAKTPIAVSKLGQVSVALGAAWMAKNN